MITKLYTEEIKYGGDGDTFDYKFNIFLDICGTAGLPRSALDSAFRVMLKGTALDHYYANKSKRENWTLEEMSSGIKEYFEGAEYRRTLLTRWNILSFESVRAKNHDKDMTDLLRIFVQMLREMQHGLANNLRNDEFLQNKIITALQTVPTFHDVCARPPATLSGLMSDLRASAALYDQEHLPEINQSLFTDRRYHRNWDKPRGQQGDHRGKNNRYDEKRNKDDNGSGAYKKRCLVCNKEGCWSNRHSEKDRKQALDKVKKRMNQRFHQFCSEMEGEPPEEKEDTSGDDNSDDGTHGDEIESYILNATMPSDESDSEEVQGTAFMTEAIDEIDGRETVEALTNQAAIHALTGTTSFAPSTRYGPRVFQGIVIDTGAAGFSTGGYDQFVALQRCQHGVKLNQDKKGTVKVVFGIGEASSMGSVQVETPIGTVEFHIVEANTPFLLCLKDMCRLGVYYDNLDDELCVKGTNIKYTIIKKFGHGFLIWGKQITNYISQYLTEPELRQLHRRFGHPSVRRFVGLMDRSGHDVDRKAIEHITKFCKMCQKYSASPRRFKFTIRDPDIQFNNTIIVDIMYIESDGAQKPVLHIVDEATRFQAARWLKDVSTQVVWNTLKMCWIDTYLGPPDIISHDAGTQFTGEEFRQLTNSMSIETKTAPTEAHNSVGIVERYHLPLRRAYSIITEELRGASTGISKEMALQMAVKAINDTAGPDGLVPTLLVFGAFPRMTKLDPPAPSMAVRSKAIAKAMKEVTKMRIDRQITDALRQRNGPRVDEVHELPINSKVWVWREDKGWTGPHTLLTVDRETCTVQTQTGTGKFRTTVVKPFLTDDDRTNGATDDESAHPEEPVDSQEPDVRHNPVRQRRLPERFRQNVIGVYLNSKERLDLELSKKLRFEGVINDPGLPFELSRKKELDGLRDKGVFELTDAKVAQGRIFKSRFVDEVKGKATSTPFEKSRLVIQAYNDEEKTGILTQSPTIQKASQRLILCLAASIKGTHLYLRDVSQAYVQSKTSLNREIYATPPKEIEIQPGKVMKIKKPLYGIPEAGTHWFRTYHRHHIENLCMRQSTYDACLLHTFQKGSECFGVVGLQTDDTLFAGNEAFAKLENNELHKAKIAAKDIEILSSDNAVIFNGGIVEKDGQSITLKPKKQGDRIELIDVDGNKPFQAAYVSQRARGAYLASICQPEASFDLSVAAQNQVPSVDDAKMLNKRLQWQQQNKERGLRFVPINLSTAKLFVFVDASFANNKDCSSQIGFLIVLANELADENPKADRFEVIGNIIHWGSIKCKRVTRSVLASELYGMVYGFDMGIAIKSTINNIVDQLDMQPIPLHICTDSRSLYDCLVKLSTTNEKRLMIDVMALRQSYENREIAEVRWIDGRDNPADAMTKATPCRALKDLVETNTLEVRVDGWVERERLIV